jgi:hypothetical protein
MKRPHHQHPEARDWQVKYIMATGGKLYSTVPVPSTSGGNQGWARLAEETQDASL